MPHSESHPEPHSDPDVIALLALGEPVDAAIAAHIDACADCHAELREFRRVVGLARSLTPEDRPVAPDPAVWERISAEIAADPRPAPAPPVIASPPPALPPPPPPRRSWRPAPAVLAAAAGFTGIALGLGLGFAIDDSGSPGAVEPETGTPTVLARAALDPLPDKDLAGTAEVRDDAGRRILHLSLAGGLPGDGYREVWLLTSDASGMVSLGVLRGTEADLVLPDGLDLADYPVVDVSQEHFDGDPGHSSDSLSRGTLA